MRDPHVIAIKMTLYRIGANSPLIPLLIQAAEAGKQVAVLVELKARFDERNNILWAKRLESHGIHVVYGFADLKTHAKLCLVVRKEPDGIQRYVHTGTGNYNPHTAKVYTDIGLFTADPDIVADVSDIFNYLTGYSNQKEFRSLLVAPVQLRDAADRADHARGGARPGRPAGAHHHQGQRDHRRPDDPRAVSRVAGGRVDRPASSAASAACARAFPASATTSACARSSAGSSSTRASTGSRTAGRTRCTSAAPI